MSRSVNSGPPLRSAVLALALRPTPRLHSLPLVYAPSCVFPDSQSGLRQPKALLLRSTSRPGLTFHRHCTAQQPEKPSKEEPTKRFSYVVTKNLSVKAPTPRRPPPSPRARGPKWTAPLPSEIADAEEAGLPPPIHPIFDPVYSELTKPTVSRFAPTKLRSAKETIDPRDDTPDEEILPPLTPSEMDKASKEDYQRKVVEVAEAKAIAKRDATHEAVMDIVLQRDRPIFKAAKEQQESLRRMEKEYAEQVAARAQVEALAAKAAETAERPVAAAVVPSSEKKQTAATIAEIMKPQIAQTTINRLREKKKDPLLLQKVTKIDFTAPETDMVQRKLAELPPLSRLEELAMEQAMVAQGLPVKARHWLPRMFQLASNFFSRTLDPQYDLVRTEDGFQLTAYNDKERKNALSRFVPWEHVLEHLQDPMQLADLAAAYRREEKHKLADQVIRVMMERFGKDPKAVEEIASTMVIYSTPLDAYPWVRRAFDIGEQKARRHLHACVEILHQLGNTDRLLETLNEGLIADSGDFYLNLKAAEVHGELGNPNTQMMHLKRVKIPDRLDSPEPFLIYADLLYNVGLKEDCARVLRRVVREFPRGGPLPYMKLVLLCLESNDDAGAKEYEKRAIMAVEYDRREYMESVKRQFKEAKRRKAAGEDVGNLVPPDFTKLPEAEFLVKQKLEELKAASNSPVFSDEPLQTPAASRVPPHEKIYAARAKAGL